MPNGPSTVGGWGGATLGTTKKKKAAPWSPAPGISAFESMIPGQAAVSGDLSSALVAALQGQFPEEYFSTAIAGPLRRRFEAERAPAIREEFAGPGTFWGTARAGAVERGRAGMEEGITGARSELAYQTQLQALQAALSYLGIPLMAAYQPYDEGGAGGGTDINALLNALRAKPVYGPTYSPGSPGIYAGPTPTL